MAQKYLPKPEEVEKGLAWWGRMPFSDWTEREKLERRKERKELLGDDRKPEDSDESPDSRPETEGPKNQA